MTRNLNIGGFNWLAMQSYLDAKNKGDFRRLLERLRDFNVVLESDEREFIADFLEKNQKRPKPGRPSEELLRYKNARIYETYYWLINGEKLKPKVAKGDCQNIYGISLSTLKKIIAEFDDPRRRQWDTWVSVIDDWLEGKAPEISYEDFRRGFRTNRSISAKK